MVAVLLACWPSPARSQDRAWDESIESARRAVASRQFDQAVRILRQARSRSRGFEPDDPRRVVPLMELAKLHLGRGDYARPEQLYLEADPIARQAWGTESAEYAALMNDIGRYYHLRVRHDEAERFYRLGFGIRVRLLGREHPEVAASVNNLAVLYENQVQYPKAESYYRTALEIREKSLGPEHPDTILTLEHFARLLHQLSRADEAAEFEQRAREFRTAESRAAATGGHRGRTRQRNGPATNPAGTNGTGIHRRGAHRESRGKRASPSRHRHRRFGAQPSRTAASGPRTGPAGK